MNFSRRGGEKKKQRAYLEKRTVKQLFSSSDDGVLILVLPLQSLGEPLDQGGQRAACETLQATKQQA